MRVRAFLRNYWPTVMISVTAAAIGCAAIVMFSNMPPHRIVMATGPEGGTYYEVGQRYRAALARENVDVQLVPTQGSIENLAMLHDPHSGVSVALVQGGSIGAGQKSGLESLGTLFYEPMWWFRKRDVQGVGAASLLGRKVAIGSEGSGTRALMLELLRGVGIEKQIELLPLGPRAASDKLLAGEIDVAFMMTSWESPVVRQLIADERVGLSGFPRADAFVALYPYINKVVVPRGVGNLTKDQPPNDVTLIATKASLVVRDDLHPALQYLLLGAAAEIHSGQSIFNRTGEFPAAEAIDIPLQRSAAVLQIGPSSPARLFSILDGGADRQADHPADSDPGRTLPNDSVFAPSLRLVDAIENLANVRRAASLGRRDGKCRRRRAPHRRDDRTARSPGGRSKSRHGAGRICEYAVQFA